MKTFLILIFGLLSMQIARSQIKFGVKAGLNITNLNISGQNVSSGIEPRGDLHAGLIANVHISKSFDIQPEVIYSSQGGNIKDSTGSLKYDYINVPVLLQYHVVSGIFIETGPQLGFLISSKYSSEHIQLDTKNQSKTTDFSWAFGVGYKMPVVNLGLDLRYNLGISNTSTVPPFVAKNSVFQFGVFFLF